MMTVIVMSEIKGMEYLVLVEKPYTESGESQEWLSVVVTATDPHAAVRAVMEEDCPLQIADWVVPGCRAWAMPWLGVTGFTWATTWAGTPTSPPIWYGVPSGARNLPGEPAGHWSSHCYVHDRAPGIDPRTGALTCGPGIGGAEEHGQAFGYRFVPSTGTMVAGAEDKT